MPVNPELQGREFPPTQPYLVGREKVREFARAVFATTAPADVESVDQLFVLQLSCQSWIVIDNMMYGLRGLDAFVFGLDGCTRNATSLSPTAFRQTLNRTG